MPMMSVFNDVIRAYRMPFFTVFRKFELLNFVGHRVDPKRHFLASQHAFWAFMRQNPSTGHFIRWVREKNKVKIKIKIKKERPYISRISPDAPVRMIGTNFGLCVRLMDVINCAKFYGNRLRRLISVSGLSFTIATGLWCRRQHRAGLPSACD